MVVSKVDGWVVLSAFEKVGHLVVEMVALWVVHSVDAMVVLGQK